MTPELIAAAERYDKNDYPSKTGEPAAWDSALSKAKDADILAPYGAAYILAVKDYATPLSELADEQRSELGCIGGPLSWRIDLPGFRRLHFCISGVGKVSLYLVNWQHPEQKIALCDNPTLGQLRHLIAAIGKVEQ